MKELLEIKVAVLTWNFLSKYSKIRHELRLFWETFEILTNLSSMFTAIIPKLPMRDRAATREYYTGRLHFTVLGEYPDYLILSRDQVELHFFLFEGLDPLENYGQAYIRTGQIDELYQTLLREKTEIHPNGHLQTKPWGQREFALLDPDNNLLTFGQRVGR